MMIHFSNSFQTILGYYSSQLLQILFDFMLHEVQSGQSVFFGIMPTNVLLNDSVQVFRGQVTQSSLERRSHFMGIGDAGVNHAGMDQLKNKFEKKI